ncbi:MAG: Enoyl-CoA hydratase [Tardiphaga sp.]|uniref:enoyl-CoA hydratase-related protein n=1 Tax=Tardiphaga sp. TaxID=1926292 RepID=UPI00260F66AD|nr:enoyl-CoA hydratase-related protein [Tardiphaga sp.]MDB5502351.1 Enoyl-CoA hydratase [Tardiphaga sp.]
MKTPGDIHIDIADGIATLRLTSPARRNAISTAMWNKIAAFAGDVGNWPDVRVVLIRGDGEEMFSAGADISDFATARSGEGQARAYDDLVENTCKAIEAIPQPTIGLIYGGCMGAGSSVAASCDLRVAADDAFFAVPAAKLGLGYDPRGIARFIRVFGAGATRQVLFTADRLPALRAYALGAVHVVAAKNEVAAAASVLAQKIAGNAPLTIKAAKAAIRAITTDNAELLAEAEQFYAAADASADYAEGRLAFAEKRPPRFTGA